MTLFHMKLSKTKQFRFHKPHLLFYNSKKDIPVGLWGGVFQHNEIFRDVFRGLLCNAGFDNVKLIGFTPEIGAIFAGYKFCGIEIVENITDNIKSTYKAERL